MNMIIRRNNRPATHFDRLFNDMWRNNAVFNEFQNNEYALALDVDENEDAYTVVTAVPGVKAEDIQINLNDDILSISAETSASEVKEGEKRVVSERRYGKFSRSLRLPVTVDANGVEAHYENGVLTVHIPKAEETKPRQIPVKVANN